MEGQRARIGTEVPDFSATAFEKGDFRKMNLSDYRGKWVVLFFYTKDGTGICRSEVAAFSDRYKDFEALEAVVIGASTGSESSHKSWLEKDFPQLEYPVIADSNHSVSRLFGVLKEELGIDFRGTFIIDPEGVLRHSTVSDMAVGRSVEETLRVLQALSSGELCPVEWRPGSKTLGPKKS